MNRLIGKYTVKNIINNKSKAPIIIISVVVICFMLFISFIVPPVMNNVVDIENKTNFGETDISAIIKDEGINSFEDIRKLTKDNSQLMDNIIKYSDVFLFQTDYNFNNRKYSLNIYAGYFDRQQAIYPFTLNSELKELKGNEIIISSSISKKFGLIVGDYIALKGISFVVSGIGGDGLFKDELNYGVFINKNIMSNLGYSTSLFNILTLDVKENVDIDKMMESMKEIFPFFDVSTVVNHAANDNFLKQMKLPFYLCAIILIIFCFLIIYSSLSLVFAERATQYATLRSLGAKNSDIFISMISESLIYGIIGNIIGLLMGFIFINFLKNGAKLEYIYGIEFKLYAYAFLTSLFMVAASAVFPAIKNYKKNVRDEIGKEYSVSKLKKILLVTLGVLAAATLSFIFSFSLGDKSLWVSIISAGCLLIFIYIIPYFVRMIIALLSRIKTKPTFTKTYVKNSFNLPSIGSSLRIISVGIFIVLFILHIVDYQTLLFNKSAFSITNYYINGVTGESNDIKDSLEREFGIGDIFEMTTSNMSSIVTDDSIVYNVYGLDGSVINKKLGKFLVGDSDEICLKLDDSSKNYIILNLSFKYTLDVDIGEEIEINIDTGKNIAEKFIICGFLDSNERYTKYALMNRTVMNKILDIRTSNTICFSNDSQYEDEEVLDFINNRFRALVNSYEENGRADRKVAALLLTVFYGFAVLVVSMTLIVFSISIAFALLQTINQHKIMASFGLTKDKFNLLIIEFFASITLIAGVFGVILFFIISSALPHIIILVNLYMKLNISFIYIIAVCLLTLMFGIITTYIMIRKYYNRNITNLGKLD